MMTLPAEEIQNDSNAKDIKSEDRGQQRKVNKDRFRRLRFQVRGREELTCVIPDRWQYWWRTPET